MPDGVVVKRRLYAQSLRIERTFTVITNNRCSVTTLIALIGLITGLNKALARLLNRGFTAC